MSRYAVLIAARMGSSRFPGKTLSEINGKPMLEILVDRLKYSKNIGKIIVATTESEVDDAIEKWCALKNHLCYRGSKDDVLQRLLDAANYFKLNTIVEVLGDNPFIHSDLVDDTINLFSRSEYDYVATITNEYGILRPELKRFPIGIRVQVFSMATLRRCAKLAKQKQYREHATSFIIENKNIFKMGFIEANNQFNSCNRPELTFAVNLRKNFELINNLYNECIKINPNFSIQDLISVYDSNPDWHWMMGNE
tara:strand:- start:3576 stop:4331 length:756 start_codon:yes stop_codon:yes gene_type:complete